MKKTTAALVVGLIVAAAALAQPALRKTRAMSLPEPAEVAAAVPSIETIEAMHEFSAGLFRKADQVRIDSDAYSKTIEDKSYELGRSAGLTEAAVSAARWEWGR